MPPELRTHLEAMRYPETFELILKHYQQKVLRLTYAMTGNPAFAEDVAQDAFIRVWKALPGYRGDASISTWIYTITRNACLSALKASSSRRVVSLDQPNVRTAVEVSHSHGLPAETDIDWDHLIAQLPEKHRRVIVLFHLEERSYEEVARMLDLPMGTVKTYLHSGRKELAEAILRSRLQKGVC